MSKVSSQHEPPVTDTELAQRVGYALLLPAARLALAFELPMKELGRQLQTACFQVLRDRGLTLRDTADRLGVSASLAAGLSKRLKERFLVEGGAPALSRRIEFMLWAEPMSEARLIQVLSDDPDAVREAIRRLLDEGRVAPLGDRAGRLGTPQRASRLVRDQLRARLDGLDQLLGAVGQAVYARFFEPRRPAFARVLTMRVRPEDRAELESLYSEHLWPTLERLDAAAADCPDAEAVEVAFTWAPYRLLDERLTPPDEEETT